MLRDSKERQTRERRQIKRQTETETECEEYKQRLTILKNKINKQRDRQTNKQRDKQINKKTKKDRETKGDKCT